LKNKHFYCIAEFTRNLHFYSIVKKQFLKLTFGKSEINRLWINLNSTDAFSKVRTKAITEQKILRLEKAFFSLSWIEDVLTFFLFIFIV